MRKVTVVLGMAMLCTVFSAYAQVNKWVDEKGRVQYGDRPPAKQSSGSKQLQKAPSPPPAKKAGKPLPEQPKNYVPGDPLIERMKANEERKQRESVTAKCWKGGSEDCSESGTIQQMMDAEAKAKAKPKPKPAAASKPASREPLPADFCKRNPKVQGC